jgi:phosphonopyruvate decarboxylase
MRASDFLALLEEKGFDFFTGVPCSYLSPFVKALEGERSFHHVPAVREDIAVGIASGAYLGGKKPVVYMQNSGLGYSLEVFASLNIIYSIPLLVLVSYRGPDDPGMEEHHVMGLHTEELLRLFGLKFSLFHGAISPTEIEEIESFLAREEQPYFLLMRRGALE